MGARILKVNLGAIGVRPKQRRTGEECKLGVVADDVAEDMRGCALDDRTVSERAGFDGSPLDVSDVVQLPESDMGDDDGVAAELSRENGVLVRFETARGGSTCEDVRAP